MSTGLKPDCTAEQTDCGLSFSIMCPKKKRIHKIVLLHDVCRRVSEIQHSSYKVQSVLVVLVFHTSCCVRKLFTWFDRIQTTTPVAILLSVCHTKCAQRLAEDSYTQPEKQRGSEPENVSVLFTSESTKKTSECRRIKLWPCIRVCMLLYRLDYRISSCCSTTCISKREWLLKKIIVFLYHLEWLWCRTYSVTHFDRLFLWRFKWCRIPGIFPFSATLSQ